MEKIRKIMRYMFGMIENGMIINKTEYTFKTQLRGYKSNKFY